MGLSNADWEKIDERIAARLDEAAVPEGATMFLIDRSLRDLIQDTNKQVNAGFQTADVAFRELLDRTESIKSTGEENTRRLGVIMEHLGIEDAR